MKKKSLRNEEQIDVQKREERLSLKRKKILVWINQISKKGKRYRSQGKWETDIFENMEETKSVKRNKVKKAKKKKFELEEEFVRIAANIGWKTFTYEERESSTISNYMQLYVFEVQARKETQYMLTHKWKFFNDFRAMIWTLSIIIIEPTSFRTSNVPFSEV